MTMTPAEPELRCLGKEADSVFVDEPNDLLAKFAVKHGRPDLGGLNLILISAFSKVTNQGEVTNFDTSVTVLPASWSVRDDLRVRNLLTSRPAYCLRWEPYWNDWTQLRLLLRLFYLRVLCVLAHLCIVLLLRSPSLTFDDFFLFIPGSYRWVRCTAQPDHASSMRFFVMQPARLDVIWG